MNSEVRNQTASLWMTKQSFRAEFPLDGQGSTITGAGSSLVAGASAGRPVVIDGILVEGVTGANREIRIQDLATPTVVYHTVYVKASTTQTSQYIPIGGRYGMTIPGNFCVRVDGSGTTSLPYTSGADYVGLIYVFFRYA